MRIFIVECAFILLSLRLCNKRTTNHNKILCLNNTKINHKKRFLFSPPKVPNDAPLRFLQLVDTFNVATSGELGSLYESLDGVCSAQGDLNAKKTFLDAHIRCATEDCVNLASDLMASGAIQALINSND